MAFLLYSVHHKEYLVNTIQYQIIIWVSIKFVFFSIFILGGSQKTTTPSPHASLAHDCQVLTLSYSPLSAMFSLSNLLFFLLSTTKYLTMCSYHVTYALSCLNGTPCLKQVRYLTFKWLQRDSNPEHLVRKRTLNDWPNDWAVWLNGLVSSSRFTATITVHEKS